MIKIYIYASVSLKEWMMKVYLKKKLLWWWKQILTPCNRTHSWQLNHLSHQLCYCCTMLLLFSVTSTGNWPPQRHCESKIQGLLSLASLPWDRSLQGSAWWRMCFRVSQAGLGGIWFFMGCCTEGIRFSSAVWFGLASCPFSHRIVHSLAIAFFSCRNLARRNV